MITCVILSDILISYSIQLLVALKVRYPQRITILRGNHESRQVLVFTLHSNFKLLMSLFFDAF
jgi:hypothetical protein